MTARTPLLGSLGSHVGQSESSDLVLRFNLTLPESGERELEAGVNKLPSWSTIEELTKGHEYQPETLTWVADVLPRTNQSYSFLFKKPEFPSDVTKFGTTEAEKPITFASKSAKESPYHGRITGPVRFVKQLLATWHLEPESACILLGFGPSRLTYVNDVLQGHETLTERDAKDRIAHLFQIRKLLAALFQDETVENEWLREPQDVLKGKTPMALLLEGSMENLLLVREYVELVAGR